MKNQAKEILTIPVLVATALLASACNDTKVTTPTAVLVGAPTVENLTDRGWIYGRGGVPVEVGYQVLDGMAIFEEDIILGRYGTIPRSRHELESRRTANLSFVTSAGGTRWPGGVVPFTISTSFSTAERDSILAGIAMINQAAYGVTIRPKVSADLSWVSVQKDATYCSSLVGRAGGEQMLYLTSNCASRPGVVVHEYLHALGAFHEQSRCDRDSYVTVNTSNLTQLGLNNFSKMCSGANDYFEYDEGSVLHYGAYTNNTLFVFDVTQPMVVSKRGRTHLMGNRDSLVSVDRRTINAIYPPPSPVVSVTYDTNGHPVFSWPSLPGVQYYRIFYTTTHHFYSPEYGSILYEGTTYPGWTTTSTSWTDFSKQYPGGGSCYYYNPEVPEEEWRTYGYAVEAVYADATTRTLTGADVFDCPPY